MDEVCIGSVWFVWGDHQRVVEQRGDGAGREVRLESVTTKQARKQPWVLARLVAHHGVPSSAYEVVPA